MATTEDIARLILEADTKGFADAQAAITGTRVALDTLTADYKAGVIGIDEYYKEGAKLQDQLADLTRGYNVAGEAVKKYGSSTAAAAALAEGATDRARNKLAGLGQTGLQTGRVIQDFTQGGLAGVLNNIEGLTQAIGGGAGLAGTLTILGTAFFVLKPVIAEFIKSMSPEPVKGFQGAIETLQARIKELTDKPIKFSADIKEIENAKEQIDAITKGLAALEAAKSGRTEDEVAAGDKFAKEFAATGGEGKAAIEDVERVVGAAAAANDPKVRAARKALADRERSQARTEQALKEAEAKVEEAKGFGDPDFVRQVAAEAALLSQELQQIADPEEMRKLRDKVKQASDDARKLSDSEVGNTFADVKKGNNPIARDVMAERFRAAGQDKFAAMVEEASPEAIRKRVTRDQSAGIDADNRKAFDEWKKAEEKKRLREAEKAGQEAEQSPEFKREQAAIDRKFKGVGLVDVDRDAVLQRNKKAAEAEAKTDANGKDKLDKVPDLEQQQKARRERAQENLAKRIYQGSQQATGVQFTPDQAREAAKATADMVGQNVNYNVALQTALGQQIQAMVAIANRIQQQQVQMQQLANGFGQVNQFMRRPGGPANLPGGR